MHALWQDNAELDLLKKIKKKTAVWRLCWMGSKSIVVLISSTNITLPYPSKEQIKRKSTNI